MPTGGGGGCSTSRQRSGCIRTSGRAPRQDTTETHPFLIVVLVGPIAYPQPAAHIQMATIVFSLGRLGSHVILYGRVKMAYSELIPGNRQLQTSSSLLIEAVVRQSTLADADS
jgi:hypothetical protein